MLPHLLVPLLKGVDAGVCGFGTFATPLGSITTTRYGVSIFLFIFEKTGGEFVNSSVSIGKLVSEGSPSGVEDLRSSDTSNRLRRVGFIESGKTTL